METLQDLPGLLALACCYYAVLPVLILGGLRGKGVSFAGTGHWLLYGDGLDCVQHDLSVLCGFGDCVEFGLGTLGDRWEWRTDG